MQVIRAESWNELNELLFDGTWNPSLGRFRSNMVYRGMGEADWRLTTALMRLGGDFAALESHILRNFRKYAHREAAPTNAIWSWLAVAQHHGLPTRLMDWTYSPLVAAHFATWDLGLAEQDGAIWCIDYVKANDHLPAKLRRIIDEEGCNAFTVEMLDRGATSLKAFDALAEGEPFVVFLEPPSLDDRIVNQFALFSVLSDSRTLFDDWLAARPELFRKIVIPAELKWEVRDKLDQSNMTERVLFPGLDGLSRWLTRHYSPASGPYVSQSTTDLRLADTG